MEAASLTGKLGRYQLVRHLASGGMADLVLARATGNAAGSHVVIKRVRADRARDHRFVQMFLHEARLAASLHHENIIRVHEIGQEDGELFFAMEFVHGEDLRRLLVHLHTRAEQVPLEHVLRIALSAAAALHHAHELTGPGQEPRGIVHRDVSPANILVGYDGRVKVVDFGIAEGTVQPAGTDSGVMKGKVAYLSPEQCVGDPIDRRSDIFCLGIVLYELVTVRRLFKAANDFLTMSAIAHGSIPSPSAIRPGLPVELERIILTALARDPEDRYQTADELRDALEAFATAHHLATSATALATYMRSVFGERREPWLDAPAACAPDMTTDFDPAQCGVVEVPEAARGRFPDEASAPIVAAHARTAGEPGEAPRRANEREVEPRLRGNDETLFVRAAPPATTVYKRAGAAIGAMLALGSIIGVIATRDGVPAARVASRPGVAASPDIRLPPPMTVDLELTRRLTGSPEPRPSPTERPAEQPSRDEATPPSPGFVRGPGVKLRARPDAESRPSVKRGPRWVRRPPVKRPETSWNPTALFPEK